MRDRGSNSAVKTGSKPAAFALIFIALAISPGFGQQPRLQLDHLDKLADRAVESVDINLDGPTIRLTMGLLLGGEGSVTAKIKQVIKHLERVEAKWFEFEQEKQYSEADLDPIRKQLGAPGWSKIAGFRRKRTGHSVDVYIKTERDQIVGAAVIIAEPKELLVASVFGPLDLDSLADLLKHFGLSRFDIERLG
jgi:uncharacterized protein DUF4252